MKAAVPRETPPAGDGLVAVVMPLEKAHGVRAFGDLKPGVVYRVTAEEAVRLVSAKGFVYAADLGRPAATNDAAAAVVATPEG